MKFLNKKWLYVNEEVAYRKILKCDNKNKCRKILGKIKYKWFNNTKLM